MTTIEILIVVFTSAILVAATALIVVRTYRSVSCSIRRRNFRNDTENRRYASTSKPNRRKSKEN